jgi:hypothetical protein
METQGITPTEHIKKQRRDAAAYGKNYFFMQNAREVLVRCAKYSTGSTYLQGIRQARQITLHSGRYCEQI